MDVSIIIVNYKTLPLIINCIHSIIKWVEGINYEIIVVDNNSNDDFQIRLKREFGSDVICLPLTQNLGFGCANNEGVKIAKGRNILCLNPDTILLNNAVKILSDYLDNHSDVAICGGNLYDENLKPAHSFCRTLPSIFWELNLLFMNIPEKIRFNKNRHFNYSMLPIEVGYITGADLMIKKNIFNDIGGFSSDFFMYYEETDLCCRVKSAKYNVISVPQAKIQHLEGKSFGEYSIKRTQIVFLEEGRMIYYKRNHSCIYIFISNIIYWLYLLSRFLFYKYRKNQKYKYFEVKIECFFKTLKKQK